MTFESDPPSIDVGQRVRQLRGAQGISMRRLAARSGLSANALSMIERGRSSPSVSTLYKLADVLGISITELFGPERTTQHVILVRGNERSRLPFARGLWEGLGGEKFSGRGEPFLLTLESGGRSGQSTMVHTGHEFVFCLRGQLE